MVLIVDDDARFLEEAESVMKKEWHVLFARDGTQARSLLNSFEFSVVLVDLNLPDCNGFQLIEEMHRARPKMPIVAFSGVCSQAVLESAKAFGAVDCLSKPATGEWEKTVSRLRLARAG